MALPSSWIALHADYILLLILPNLPCASVHSSGQLLSHPGSRISVDDPFSATNVRWRTDASRAPLIQIVATSEYPDGSTKVVGDDGPYANLVTTTVFLKRALPMSLREADKHGFSRIDKRRQRGANARISAYRWSPWGSSGIERRAGLVSLHLEASVSGQP